MGNRRGGNNRMNLLTEELELYLNGSNTQIRENVKPGTIFGGFCGAELESLNFQGGLDIL